MKDKSTSTSTYLVGIATGVVATTVVGLIWNLEKNRDPETPQQVTENSSQNVVEKKEVDHKEIDLTEIIDYTLWGALNNARRIYFHSWKDNINYERDEISYFMDYTHGSKEDITAEKLGREYSLGSAEVSINSRIIAIRLTEVSAYASHSIWNFLFPKQTRNTSVYDITVRQGKNTDEWPTLHMCTINSSEQEKGIGRFPSKYHQGNGVTIDCDEQGKCTYENKTGYIISWKQSARLWKWLPRNNKRYDRKDKLMDKPWSPYSSNSTLEIPEDILRQENHRLKPSDKNDKNWFKPIEDYYQIPQAECR